MLLEGLTGQLSEGYETSPIEGISTSDYRYKVQDANLNLVGRKQTGCLEICSVNYEDRVTR